MIEREVLQIVDAMLAPEFARQERKHHNQIEITKNQAALEGLSQSVALLRAVHREHVSALTERAELTWSTMAEVFSKHDLAWSVGACEDLKSEWAARYRPFAEALIADFEHLISVPGFRTLES